MEKVTQNSHWEGFKPGNWQTEIDVAAFIKANFKGYDGDSSFLSAPTKRTKNLYSKVSDLFKQEMEKGGVLDIAVDRPITITAFGPGYIDKSDYFFFVHR